MNTSLHELTEEEAKEAEVFGFTSEELKELNMKMPPTHEEKVLSCLENIQTLLEQIDGMLRSRF